VDVSGIHPGEFDIDVKYIKEMLSNIIKNLFVQALFDEPGLEVLIGPEGYTCC
jgi:hypothetical protein